MLVFPAADQLYLHALLLGSSVMIVILFTFTCLGCSGRSQKRLYKEKNGIPNDTADCKEPDPANDGGLVGVQCSSGLNETMKKKRASGDATLFTLNRALPPFPICDRGCDSEVYTDLSNKTQWKSTSDDTPVYAGVSEVGDERNGEALYCQVQADGKIYYDNIDDGDFYDSRPLVSINRNGAYDYPKFEKSGKSFLPCFQGTSMQTCPNLQRDVSELYAVINKLGSAQHSVDSNHLCAPFYRAKLARRRSDESEPLYAVIEKGKICTGSVVCVSGRRMPHSEPSVVELEDYGPPFHSFQNKYNNGNGASVDVKSTKSGSSVSTDDQSSNYRYLSVREPLEIVRRRLEMDPHRHILAFTIIHLSMNLAISAMRHVPHRACIRVNTPDSLDFNAPILTSENRDGSNVLVLKVQEFGEENNNRGDGDVAGPSTSYGIYDNILDHPLPDLEEVSTSVLCTNDESEKLSTTNTADENNV
ncbi:hypothetical protein T4B_7479 [Trichinella pseudospiralis]|uniref:Uncharacterized protein n=1 Tax=Trichinella pseudospiralis TaxID=6337 RepID=A0A0V1ILD7_TRIPS|nr:hypothetical protein T4B_7479 [Trichinella pseudospiralis]